MLLQFTSWQKKKKKAAVHPERPPSDMTSSTLQWEEQRPPQKLPLTLWHCWASSLPVH